MTHDQTVDDVQEVTLRLSVMMQADTVKEAEAFIADRSIEDLGRDIDTGDLIGATQIIAARTVPAEQVHRRLLAYGNDGSFFEGVTASPAGRVRSADAAILALQINQGWSADTLMQLAANFLRESDLQEAFLTYLDGVARLENDAAFEP